jgi:transcriptional regulator GlxA family with amidase domain
MRALLEVNVPTRCQSRFERAGALLRTSNLDLASVTVECGYYD